MSLSDVVWKAPLVAVPVDGDEPGEVDLERVERGVRELLLGLGQDPDSERLRDTPSRVARAYRVPRGPSG